MGAKARKWGTSPSKEDFVIKRTFPYPEETGKANDMSLGDLERQKIFDVKGSLYIDRR